MSLLYVADSFYVGVRDLNAATSWYMEKLGLKRTKIDVDEEEGCIGLTFSKDVPAPIILGPVSDSEYEPTKMLYTGNIERAHEWLNSHGVRVGAIETDRQGTKYFSMQDLEGNAIEVSEEP
jgi:catechol 2,3-dioxygenase-like lactoylglutathione lyase family enzyme